MSFPADSSCEGRVSLHFTQPGLSMPAAAGVVDEKGSEYILAHTGLRELDRHPLWGCGLWFGLVPSYTTLSIRVRGKIKSSALKIKSVRTNKRLIYCTGHKTHRDKLPTSHLLLMVRQVFAITHIRMQVVWAQQDHPT